MKTRPLVKTILQVGLPAAVVFLSACSIRAVALIETEDASYGGETTIQRKQDKIVERQHTLFENVINGTPQVTPTPELP